MLTKQTGMKKRKKGKTKGERGLSSLSPAKLLASCYFKTLRQAVDSG